MATGFVGCTGSLSKRQQVEGRRLCGRSGADRGIVLRRCKSTMCATEAEPDVPAAMVKSGRNEIPTPALMLVLPESSTGNIDKLEAFIAEAVEGGVNIVQIREKTTYYETLEKAVERLHQKFPDLTLMVNSNIGVAMKHDGVGIHLPEDLSKFHQIAREKTSDQKLIGSSVHSVAAAEKALLEGSDYLLVGTMYNTESHPDKDAEGILMLKMIRRSVGQEIPMIAIGGIKPENVSEVVAAGAVGVAVMTGLTAASNVKEAAEKYKQALADSWKNRQE
eukprot:Plantae.Rhodophyta-Purpureofilum_apyrenoidigerum.ctg6353.p1 GENE.Plantae.Rhodophyta-Purpureofilum_apyrenoidigerum.ctg6353~~Plantae.Rhodophyta-Purpureofilum_apyrenoidigerum.ctg6353.p1  ORF type:complete len:277 (-),score=56.42 Plantae.Rhodophyta-Purpureofilum_apyrenoidigerum.ctg6353:341-1171(-)